MMETGFENQPDCFKKSLLLSVPVTTEKLTFPSLQKHNTLYSLCFSFYFFFFLMYIWVMCIYVQIYEDIHAHMCLHVGAWGRLRKNSLVISTLFTEGRSSV